MSRLGHLGGRLYRGEISYDFVGRKRRWYMISGAILLISVVALFVRGLDFSVDFKGGAVFQFSAPSVSQTQVQDVVSGQGVSGAIVQQLTGKLGNRSWQVQTPTLTSQETGTVETALLNDLHATNMSTTFVGASWGGQITTKAIQALITFLIVIVLYLSIAFEWKMAVAAFVALIHDLVIATGVYALTGFQVSPATVIGLLTILGYSLYDTVVVFDKVRENTAGLLGGARSTYSEAANLALNQTLVRSINTSLIALLPVAAILFVGGGLLGAGELKDLALVLFVGMLSGTYSSIFIATPVLADLKEREPQYQALAKRVSVRAAGGRAAKRAAKAQVGGRGTAAGGPGKLGAAAEGPGKLGTAAEGPGKSGTATAQEPLADEVADDAEIATATDYDDDAPPADALTTTASRVPAARGTPGAARPGPRQQPRRSGGTARHRPAGKKKRR
jgi:preprotein translocase subunit SecF